MYISGILFQSLLLIFSVYSVNCENKCDDWITYSNIKCFKISNQTGTELEARNYCKQLDSTATLVTIHSKEEQEFLNKNLFMLKNISDRVWIGMNYAEEMFKWIDEENIDFMNWADGSPDPIQPGRCAQMALTSTSLGKWYDETCGRKSLFVCQKRQEWNSNELRNAFENLANSLKITISNLTDSIELEQSYRSKQQDTINSLQTLIEKQKMKIDASDEQFSDLQVAIKDLTNAIEQEQFNSKQQQTKINNLNTLIENQEKKIEACEKRDNNLHAAINNLTNEIDQEQSKNNKQQDIIINLDTLIKNQEMKIEACEERDKNFQATINNLTNEIDQELSNSIQQQSKINNLNTLIENQEKKIEACEKRDNIFQAAISNLTNEIEQEKSKSNKQQDTISNIDTLIKTNLQVKIINLTNAIMQEQSNSNEQQSKINNLQTNFDRQQTTIDGLYKQSDENSNNIVDMKNDLVPVGFLYFQLPFEKSPDEIWPTFNWLDVSVAYEGVFFRVVGGGAGSFGEVQQENSPSLQKIDSLFYKDMADKSQANFENATISRGTWSKWILTGLTQGTDYMFTRYYVSGGEIRPTNMAMRIWKRLK